MRLKFIFAIIGLITSIFLTACWDDEGDVTTPSISTAFTKKELINTILVRHDYFDVHNQDSKRGYRMFIFERDYMWIMSGHGSQKYSWKIGRRGEVIFTQDEASSEFDDTCELWKLKEYVVNDEVEDRISMRFSCEERDQVIFEGDYLKPLFFNTKMMKGLVLTNADGREVEHFGGDGRVWVNNKKNKKNPKLYRDYHNDEKYQNVVTIDPAGDDGYWVGVTSKYRFFLLQGSPKSGKMVQFQYWEGNPNGKPPYIRYELCDVSAINALQDWVADSFTCNYGANENNAADGSLNY